MQRAILDVDLTALSANYHQLKQRHARGSIGAVVKANAYGLGMPAVVSRLWQEGCREFFVATLDEAITLRQSLPEACIGVFNGFFRNEASMYREHRLIPVLNDKAQIADYVARQTLFGEDYPMIVHVDTGMTRLGLTETDLSELPRSLTHSPRLLLMSHLACAGDPGHTKNSEQLRRFRHALSFFPQARASLANSSGLYLPMDFHFDLGRPGCALYGINPTQTANPMRPVVHLSAPLLQLRTLDRDETVGYDATCALPRGARVAIAALGYADGWPRHLSNRGHAFIAGQRVPILGIISMDMIALDISAVPESVCNSDTRAYFLNDQQTVDDIARACGTIGYEILTGIGTRVERQYATTIRTQA